MPWNHSDPVTERMRFVVQAKEGLYGMTELCERYGVSRQTGYDVRSPREFRKHCRGPEYPGQCEVRRVRANGILYFKNQQIFLSELLSGHDVALEEIADSVWSIYFYTLLLARLDVRTFTLS